MTANFVKISVSHGTQFCLHEVLEALLWKFCVGFSNVIKKHPNFMYLKSSQINYPSAQGPYTIGKRMMRLQKVCVLKCTKHKSS